MTQLSESLATAVGVLDTKQACAQTRELLAQGAPVNFVDSSTGTTPLHAACTSGHPAVVASLIKAGADVDVQARDGSTPLHVAAHAGHLEVAHLLLAFSARTDIPDVHGLTAWQVACVEGHPQLVEACLTPPQAPGGAVLLHVYVLGTSKATQKLHSVASALGSGLFHTAIEVQYLSCGQEWSFGFAFEGTGVFNRGATENQEHRYDVTPSTCDTFSLSRPPSALAISCTSAPAASPFAPSTSFASSTVDLTLPDRSIPPHLIWLGTRTRSTSGTQMCLSTNLMPF